MTDTQIPDMDPNTAPNGDHSEPPPPQQTKPPRASDHNAMFLRAARAGQLEQVLDFLRNGIDINTSNSNGLNALHLASKEGHNEVVRELIRRGATVDAATKKGNTALHIASLAGQDIIVTILVENGANVNAQSLNGFTPLYMSAQENHETVVRYLLAHGANQALATEDGFTPLAVALQQGHDRIVALLLENDNNSKIKLPALHIAAKKDDTRAATLLLQNEQNPNVTSKSGFTPLHIAAHYGNESIAELLLDKGANVNFQARHNISPLHVAAKWGRANLANLLLSRDATIDCRTRDLLTPLHCAARSGHEQVLDLLLDKGAPVDAKTKNGLAPLHMAAQGDHVDCARILLYHRANVDDVTVDYLTPLHVAAHCGHVRVAKLLLDRGANPNARALNGFTPLHIACKKNRNKVVELLLKYHASVEASTESGLSPLHVASFMGCINIVIFLIQQGANVDVETVRGETPLHLAARANQTDIVRVLVRNKANVDAKARELQTPLHIASRLGNTDIVVILLNANANANAATRDQYTPLHIAAKEGQEEVAVRLLDHHADKSLLTKKGFTPLHLASKYGNYEVAKLLLDRKTPVDIQGKNQVTPLHVAAHYNNERVAQLLLEKGASAKATAKNGYTPLHIAAKKNQMDIASGLLAYRADPNAESRAGFTPLHLASEEGHQEMGALLIEHGSHVNAQAKNGLTPLHLCAQEDRVNVAAELLNNRAEINAQTKAGYTPLHVACHFGQMNMVRFLIENGALVSAQTKANYTPLHQAAQQGHNNVVRYLLDNGASPNLKTTSGQTPLSIAQRLGYVSVVETLKTVTETTVITETTTITEERYNPQNPEAMNETMFSDSEDEVDEHQVATQDHAKDFNESITQGLRDTDVIHLIHTGEQAKTSPFDTTDADLEAVIKRAQNAPVTTAIPDPSFIENGHDDNIALSRDHLIQPSFLISFLVDARGGAMRGCRHSGVRVIIPPRKAAAPMRITCRYLKKEKLSHPPPLSEGEALASRVLEMGPHGAKFLGPVILEVPHFASLRGREREIVILRSDDGQHWKEHQLEATEDAVQEVLNESFDASELQQLDDLHTSRITRILTNDFPMYFAVVTRVRQEVHCVGPEGGVILSSVIPRVQAIFPDGSLTKTIKVSLQAQPVPHELVTKLHGNRVAVSPIVTVEPRRRKFHKPITLCIPLPSTGHKGMLTQFANQQQAQEPPTLRLLCSITGGSSPAQWEDITGTTQLTFTGEDVSFTTTVSARFWLMDCQTPRDAARMAQEVYNEAISVPYMAKFVVFARRPFPIEGQLRLFCMTDDREDKTLEKQEGFIEVAKSRDVEVLSNRHQFLEFAGNLVPVTKSGDQLSVFFLPFQENRLAFNVKVRQSDSEDAAQAGRIAIMKEAKIRAENIPPQHPICTLTITLPEYTGPLPTLRSSPLGAYKEDKRPINVKYSTALAINPADTDVPIEFVARKIGPDWPRLARTLQIPDSDVRQIKRELSSNGGAGQEPLTILKIWIHLKSTEATVDELQQALRKIGRDDIVQKLKNKNELDEEGDSLRLTDTPNLGRSTAFSSKGSLGGTTAIAERQPVLEQRTSPTFDVPGTTKTDEDFEPTSSQQPNGTSATTASRRAPSLQQKETTDDGFANEDGSQVVSKRMTRTVTTSQSSVSGVDAAGNIIPTDEETASQKYPNGANGTGHVDETESVASDASLRSVRDRIAIFEALQESGHAHPYQPHPKPRLSVDSSASAKFSQHHEETLAEEVEPKADEKPVLVVKPREVSPSAVTETIAVIHEIDAGPRGSLPSVQSGIAEAKGVNIAYALRESGDVSAVPADQAWHTAGKQSITGFEENTDEEFTTQQSEAEVIEKTESGMGKMELTAGAAIAGTVTAGLITSEMESPGVPESEPVLHADIREVEKAGEDIPQYTQRDDEDVRDEDIHERKSHPTEEHNFPQIYVPEASVQEEECLISEKFPAEEKEYFRHEDAPSEDDQYLHEQVIHKFEDETLPQHLEHDLSPMQEKNDLKESIEEIYPEMVTDSHDVLTGEEVRLGLQEPVPEAVFAPVDENTEVKKHSESVISMLPSEGHWSRTVVEVAEQPAVNVYTAPLTEERKQQEGQTYTEGDMPEYAAGEERYIKEIEHEWSPNEVEHSEEMLAKREFESSEKEPRLVIEEEHVGDDTSEQENLPKEYQTHEKIEHQEFPEDDDNIKYEKEHQFPLKIKEPIKEKHIAESRHEYEQEPHITSGYGSPVQGNEPREFETNEPFYGEEDKEAINISYEDHGVSQEPEKSPHFDDYGPDSIKQQSEDEIIVKNEHVEHQIGEQESVPEAILVESHEQVNQQKELEMPEETEARDQTPTHFATEYEQPEIFLKEDKEVLNVSAERRQKMSEEPFKQRESQSSAEVPSTVTCSPSSAMSFESQATVISAGKDHTYDEDLSMANREMEGVITPASTPEATPGTVDRTRSLYEQEHYGDGMAVHTEICPPEHLQEVYKESEEETIVQPPEKDEKTFEIQSQKSIEETTEGRETSPIENKTYQESPIDESYTAQALIKTKDDTEANIGEKETHREEIATPKSPEMPSSQVMVSYDLVEDLKSDEEHDMPHSEEVTLASEERPQEVEIIIEAPEETTEEQWPVEKEEIIPQSEAFGQLEQEAQRTPSPEESELHMKSEKYKWEDERIPETEEQIVDSTDVNYENRDEYVTDRVEIPDLAYEKESHDDVPEEISRPEKIVESSQIEEFEPEHFREHEEESIVDSAQISDRRGDTSDSPNASMTTIPDQHEIESPIRESAYAEDEIKPDIEYRVDEGVIDSENVPVYEEHAGYPLISDRRRSTEAEFISEDRVEKPRDEDFEEKSKPEVQAVEEDEDIMVESEEVPVQHELPSELSDHARHESYEKESHDDVPEEVSVPVQHDFPSELSDHARYDPEESTESPTMFSPTGVHAYGDKDNIFDISRSPTPPPHKETDMMTQSVYGKIHDENQLETEMHPSEDIMTQSVYEEHIQEESRPSGEQEDEELVSNYELIETAELQQESPLDRTDIENREITTSLPPPSQEDKKQRTPEAEINKDDSGFYVVDEKDLETIEKEGIQRLQSEEIIEAQAVDLVDDVLQNMADEAQEEKSLGRERSIDEEVADAEIRRVSATQLTPADGSLSPATSLGLTGAGDLFSRPKSPVPPRAAEAVVPAGSPQEEQAKTGPGSTESLPGNVDSAGSSPSISSLQRKKDQQLAIAADNLSEGSLQEFERLEQEIQLRRSSGASGGSPNGGIPAAEEKLILIQSAGSLNSLQEFENLEKEVGVHETNQAQPPEGVGAEDVMMLSDIREESDEAEEMSTREDDEDEESSADIIPSLPPQEVPKDDYQHQLDASAYAQEAMLCSVDSLEAGRQPHAGTEYGHHLMETSVDSLEAGIIHGGELLQHQREKSDSVIDNISQDSRNQPHSQETGMSADTDTTFQEYQEDEGDKDSLDGVVQSYPTTLTTFETIQTKEDGTTETITRRVLTRVTDPVHSRVRFTGTDSEDQLRNISTEPIESVDEEGNITTIRRQTIH